MSLKSDWSILKRPVFEVLIIQQLWFVLKYLCLCDVSFIWFEIMGFFYYLTYIWFYFTRINPMKISKRSHFYQKITRRSLIIFELKCDLKINEVISMYNIIPQFIITFNELGIYLVWKRKTMGCCVLILVFCAIPEQFAFIRTSPGPVMNL